MDPFPSILPFLIYTKKYSDIDRKACANKAVFIAGILAIFFLLSGPALLEILHITLADFKVGGGVILILLGIETVLGISLGKHKESGINDIAVLIATPLLTGPGLVTSLIILSRANGIFITIIALLLALITSWLTLINSIKIRDLVGDQMIQILAKIIGLILLALGVAYIRSGFPG